MISREHRIPRELFSKLLKTGNIRRSEFLNLKKSPHNETRIGVSVSKKISKMAVIRNRTRRRIYSALRPYIKELPHSLYLVSANPGADKLKGERLKSALAQLFKTI